MGSNPELTTFEALWRQGQQQEALAALAEHVAAHPDDAAAWSLCGLYLLEQRVPDRAAALEALEQSVELEPTYPAAYNAGNILLDLGRIEEALERYEQSIACFDEYPEAWVNRGIALHRAKRTAEAIASFDRALQIDDAFLPALRCRAMGLEATGDKEGSEATYAKMVELYPEDVTILSEYGRALSRLPPDNHMELHPDGREWKSVETLDRVLERNPDDLHAWLAKAEVLYRCMYANICFRTNAFEYVDGPLRTGSFQGDLRKLLQEAQQRFPDEQRFGDYLAELRAFAGDATDDE